MNFISMLVGLNRTMDEEGNKPLEEEEIGSGNGHGQSENISNITSRLCDCGSPAVVKVAGKRSQNQGLRYICCDRFTFFGKKKRHAYCRFFEWVDCPRVTKEQLREARTLKRQRKSSNSSAILDKIYGSAIAEGRENELNECTNGNNCKFDVLLEVSCAHQLSNVCVPTAMQPSGVSEEGLCNRNSIAQAGVTTTIEGEREVTSDGGGQHSADHAMRVLKRFNAQKLDFNIDACLKRTLPSLASTVDGTCEEQGDLGTASLNKQIEADYVDKKTEPAGDMAAENATGKLLAMSNAPVGSEVPECLCSRPAVYKTVKSKGPNYGLGFWVCSNSRPFYVKKQKHHMTGTKTSCKFFRWVGTPVTKSKAQREEEVLKRKELLRRKELALLS